MDGKGTSLLLTFQLALDMEQKLLRREMTHKKIPLLPTFRI